MPNAAAEFTQVTGELRSRYFALVQELPVNRSPEEHDRNRLSRALAAFAIEKLAELDPAEAATCVVDGFNDNGIDAVCFDGAHQRLWVVQSKLSSAPDMGANKKFCDGIRDLIAGRFDKFSASFASFQEGIEDALATDGVVVVGCQVHLGGHLGTHVVADLDQLETDLNQFSRSFEWMDVDLSVAHGWLTDEHTAVAPDVTLTLRRWFGVDHPKRAFYGLARADDLAVLYQQHGKALLERNIRHYLGAQAVNKAIEATARQHPEDLFYLNNGLTVVCRAASLPPGANNQEGVFNIRGFSVVNGAQTAGSLAAVRTGDGTVDQAAQVLVTIIEVGSDETAFGPAITQARNTQSAVRAVHFAALDPNQERLRREMAVSGIRYYYRPSAEAVRGGPATVTIERAAIALAALSGSIRSAVAAKKESGQLYDRNGAFYLELFSSGLSGAAVCRRVRIFDFLDATFDGSEWSASGSRRMFYRHGRYFISTILARRHPDLLQRPEIAVSAEDCAGLSRAALELAEFIYGVAQARFGQWPGYLSIFRNLTDAEHLAADVMQRLATQDAQAAGVPVSADLLGASSSGQQ